MCFLTRCLARLCGFVNTPCYTVKAVASNCLKALGITPKMSKPAQISCRCTLIRANPHCKSSSFPFHAPHLSKEMLPRGPPRCTEETCFPASVCSAVETCRAADGCCSASEACSSDASCSQEAYSSKDAYCTTVADCTPEHPCTAEIVSHPAAGLRTALTRASLTASTVPYCRGTMPCSSYTVLCCGWYAWPPSLFRRSDSCFDASRVPCMCKPWLRGGRAPEADAARAGAEGALCDAGWAEATGLLLFASRRSSAHLWLSTLLLLPFPMPAAGP